MILPMDLVIRLGRLRPLDEDPARWTIMVCDSTGRTERVYADAVIEHYPDVGHPTHVIVWTPSTVAVIDYHYCDYIRKQ